MKLRSVKDVRIQTYGIGTVTSTYSAHSACCLCSSVPGSSESVSWESVRSAASGSRRGGREVDLIAECHVGSQFHLSLSLISYLALRASTVFSHPTPKRFRSNTIVIINSRLFTSNGISITSIFQVSWLPFGPSSHQLVAPFTIMQRCPFPFTFQAAPWRAVASTP